LGRVLAVTALTLAAAAIGLAIANRESITSPDDANAIQIVLPIGFGILGGLVTSRQPGNALGWMTLAIALSMAISAVTGQYTRFAVVTQPEAPFTAWIALAGQVAEIIVYPSGLAALAILLTPNGRLLSRGWRWVAWAGWPSRRCSWSSPPPRSPPASIRPSRTRPAWSSSHG
jgi:hypothetical protein